MYARLESVVGPTFKGFANVGDFRSWNGRDWDESGDLILIFFYKNPSAVLPGPAMRGSWYDENASHDAQDSLLPSRPRYLGKEGWN